MEPHRVLYRKYRPKTFEEVVGQEHIVRTLQNALLLGRIAHAYLFAGPRGTGKTTVARLLAKAVNCAEYGAGAEKTAPRKSDACNACDLCGDFLNGRAIDLIEIDAASNRGIDEVRALREGIRFSPVKGRYKVYIIDECHMLTKEAFNALLKILEEPPAHAMFILATTEAHKVPATVASRCQRYDFSRLPFEKILGRLRTLAGREGVAAGDDALALIVQAADGSARDAESLLDQAMSSGVPTLAAEDIVEALGMVPGKALEDFLRAAARGDASAALEKLHALWEKGVDPNQFLEGVVQHLRDALLLSMNSSLSPALARQRGEDYVKRLESFAGATDAETLRRLLDCFLVAHLQLRTSPFPQLPIELAVMEAVQAPRVKSEE